jgi:hypothetical protein
MSVLFSLGLLQIIYEATGFVNSQHQAKLNGKKTAWWTTGVKQRRYHPLKWGSDVNICQ